MAEAAIGVAILALVVSALSAAATISQALSARRQVEHLERDLQESRRALIATSRRRIVQQQEAILELHLTATNVGRAHAREVRVTVTDYRRMALSDRHEFDRPFAPGHSEPFVLRVRHDQGMPHWLVYTWADDEREHQEKLELVDDLGRTTWPREEEPRIW